MFNQNQKDNAVLVHQHKKQESKKHLLKIDQSITSVELLNSKLKDIGYDVSGIIISGLQSLSKPFKEYSRQSIPLRKIPNGEFIGFITGNIIFDL